MEARFVDDAHVFASVLYEELVAVGFDRSYPTLVREIRELGLRSVCECCKAGAVKLTVGLEHEPGEELQLDWLELPETPWGAKAYVLIGALSHSSRLRGVFSEGESFPHLLAGAVRAARIRQVLSQEARANWPDLTERTSAAWSAEFATRRSQLSKESRTRSIGHPGNSSGLSAAYPRRARSAEGPCIPETADSRELGRSGQQLDPHLGGAAALCLAGLAPQAPGLFEHAEGALDLAAPLWLMPSVLSTVALVRVR